ncbi:MAG: biotin/lipoyl-containing protein, partial [Bacillota bacterium]|nr:biotin/lipoyl-containing protein [Bacillota bacterium]
MSMQFNMPKAGLTMVEGVISQWLVQEGEQVKKGDVVLNYENEKTIMDCECPGDGIIHILAQPGDVVKVGETLAYLAESQEEYQMLLNTSDTTSDAIESVGTKSSKVVPEYVSFNMPKAGLTMVEGTISEWLAQEGTEVKKGDIVLNYENEKTMMECESPESGFIHILAYPGDVVKVGDPVALLAKTKNDYDQIIKGAVQTMEKQSPAKQKKSATETAQAGSEQGASCVAKRVKASGLARNMAKNQGIDLREIIGSGPNGRIVAKDVEAFIEKKHTSSTEGNTLRVREDNEQPTLIPMTPARKAIANNLKKSISTMVQASSSTEFDVTDLFQLREKYVAQKD